MAEATSTLTSGEITSITITSGGSDYSSAPEAKVIGGPHLLRITDTSSNYYGRVFLINNNTQTNLDLDFSILAEGESGNTSTFFSAGISVEVVPATTLGNIFGITAGGSGTLPSNWSTASSLRDTASSDWVYIWDPSLGGYSLYHYVYGTSRIADGWYGSSTRSTPKNNVVIYPDEAFIIAKRTSGDVELQVEGQFPARHKSFICHKLMIKCFVTIPMAWICYWQNLYRPLLLAQERQNFDPEHQTMEMSIMSQFYQVNLE